MDSRVEGEIGAGDTGLKTTANGRRGRSPRIAPTVVGLGKKSLDTSPLRSPVNRMMAAEGGIDFEFRQGTNWKIAYQRNNKSRGQKNLRCFPNCSVGYGHQEGFCGQSIRVVATGLDGQRLGPVLAAGEFATAASPTFKVGSVITLGDINNPGADPGENTRCTYFEGTALSPSSSSLGSSKGYGGRGNNNNSGSSSNSGSIDSVNFGQDCSDRSTKYGGICLLQPGDHQMAFEFNRGLKGWHYGFHGSKKTRNMFHVFRAYLLERLPDEMQPADIPTLASYIQAAQQQQQQQQQHQTDGRSNKDSATPKRNCKELYRVIAVCQSPPWQMYCRRRKYHSGTVSTPAVATSTASTSTTTAASSGIKMEVKRGGKRSSAKADSGLNLKRRPESLQIPSQPIIRRARRSSQDPSPQFGRMSLKQALEGSSSISAGGGGTTYSSQMISRSAHGSSQHVYSAGNRGSLFMEASPSALSAPGAMSSAGYGDNRFDRMAALLTKLDYPRTENDMNQFEMFQLREKHRLSFADLWSRLLSEWTMNPYWPPNFPKRIQSFLETGDESKVSHAEKIALFMVQHSDLFKDQVDQYIMCRMGSRSSSKDVFSDTKFALQLFSNAYQHYLANLGYTTKLKPTPLSELQLFSPRYATGDSTQNLVHQYYQPTPRMQVQVHDLSPPNSTSTESATHHQQQQKINWVDPSHLDDYLFSPRSHFPGLALDDLDDFALLQQTPRGLSSYGFTSNNNSSANLKAAAAAASNNNQQQQSSINKMDRKASTNSLTSFPFLTSPRLSILPRTGSFSSLTFKKSPRPFVKSGPDFSTFGLPDVPPVLPEGDNSKKLFANAEKFLDETLSYVPTSSQQQQQNYQQ